MDRWLLFGGFLLGPFDHIPVLRGLQLMLLEHSSVVCCSCLAPDLLLLLALFCRGQGSGVERAGPDGGGSGGGGEEQRGGGRKDVGQKVCCLER